MSLTYFLEFASGFGESFEGILKDLIVMLHQMAVLIDMIDAISYFLITPVGDFL